MNDIASIPSIFDFPFLLEVTDLGTNVTTCEYFKEQQPVLDRIKSIDEEDFFAAGWNREKGELIGESHPNVVEPLITEINHIATETVAIVTEPSTVAPMPM